MGDQDSNNILSVLDNYTFETVDDIALKLSEDFRRRRIEKNLTREEVAQLADVALSNLVRFEQRGLISLKNLIALLKIS
jgi:DNA-binding XRE family transcriptional regulator